MNSFHILTPDNLHLSEPKNTKNVTAAQTARGEHSGSAVNCTVWRGNEVCAINCTDGTEKSCAINCTKGSVSPIAQSSMGHESAVAPSGATIADYVHAGMADNTHRAYAADLAHFNAWGGSFPALPAQIAEYLAQHAVTLSPATLVRRLAAISKAHRSMELPSPTSDELVRATLRGIKRTHGTAQAQARALLRDDLFDILAQLDTGVKSSRNRALLLIGFAGGFRRSELVGLNAEDIEPVRQGIIVTLKRSKTDQQGVGRRIGIPFGRTRHCPVKALEAWQGHLDIEHGPIFRSVSRHGKVSEKRLSGEAVTLIVKSYVADIGLNPDEFSGHSLRAGFATSAAQAGVATWKIRAQTGHASDAMLSRYIREGELFDENAAGALL